LSGDLAESQALLCRLLARKPPQIYLNVQIFLTSTQKAIANLATAAIGRSQEFVRLDELLEVESRIARIILRLKKDGMFPESPEDALARNEWMEQLDDFLEDD
jgi:hypothetical protein